MPTFTIAGERFILEPTAIEETMEPVLPEPIREHYVIVRGRRYPPKQVISCLTRLDRADFTTHQARRIMRRLGFTSARIGQTDEGARHAPTATPHGGRQGEVLRPYAGKWVALATPIDVLVAANSPQEVLAWLAQHRRRADYGMFRVPASREDAEGTAPA